MVAKPYSTNLFIVLDEIFIKIGFSISFLYSWICYTVATEVFFETKENIDTYLSGKERKGLQTYLSRVCKTLSMGS